MKETFFYAIPDNLLSKAEVGRRVSVPFRNRKVIGYILEKRHGDQEEGLKEILEVMDEEPLFTEGLVPFFRWMSDYYLYPVGRFIQSALPGGLNAQPFKTGQITEKGLQALKRLSENSQERSLLSWAKENPGKRLPSPLDMAYTLQKKGWLTIESRTRKRRVGPLIRKFVRAKEGLDLQSVFQVEDSSIRAKNETEFLQTVFNSDGVLLKELSAQFSNGAYLVNKWIRKGALEKYGAPVVRNLAGEVMFPSLVPSQLYDQQKAVLGEIEDRLKKRRFSTCLLYGITGSGKTEVYYRAVEEAIQQGRRALLLVPEIALVVYMEGIFRSRLGNRVAIYHSGLSEGERYDQWVRTVRGEVDLVIGARSALFSPLPKLGLIIVDEEHDFSYKQEEGPRYQARDAAVVRGKLEKALVILGSGTPSVQSFHHTTTERYQLLSMPERIEKRSLPEVQIVDMKAISQGEPGNGIISPILRAALEKTLTEGKQTILFLNRRGFNRVYLCRSCGQPIRCTNCDVALIYHLRENRLACHYCGFRSQPENRCATCGHEGMKAYGFGTERLEQELREAIPDSRIARIDRDSTRRKGQTFLILKRFSEHEIDIMVGTQMITKGYDFPEVTLVGVLAADLSLGFPDFRAGERTFQILSQVAGRAGRGDQKGKVIVQTFNPEHYAIVTARDHDYASFFQMETALRGQLGYPPFSYLACLKIQGNNSDTTANMAQRLGQGITGVLERWPRRGREIQVLGPAEAPLAKLKGKYRWQILIKCKGAELLHYFLREIDALTRKMLRGSGVSLIVDVDPYQML
ncbi:MAG: primosomal protein N' [Desulfobacteraceae bacterium]|nr:primosomal protein N' [Desulfobacteraceae bacterium]